ncbi:hypothetical protein [Superficieibacter sp.]|uniref:hypothetical protein n=1 Tax=Superficieibacter sp. TaxID=2303322 RepID=UPI0028AD696B|nr:hypothetical protein [Superficieibacter sp.]
MSKPARKTRTLRSTRLIICEGISDKKFVERIKTLYHPRNAGFSVKIDEAGGGGPKTAIQRAINYLGDFDQKYIYIDSDLAISATDRKAAERRNIHIIQSEPFCLEGLLLKITDFPREVANSQNAKEILYGQHGLTTVVTEAWYEENITCQRLNTICASKNHAAGPVLTALIAIFVDISTLNNSSCMKAATQ